MMFRVAAAALLAGGVVLAFSAMGAPRDRISAPRLASLDNIPSGMSATASTLRRVEVQPVSSEITHVQADKQSELPPVAQAASAMLPLPGPAALVAKPSLNPVRSTGWQPGAAGCTSYKTYNAQSQTYRATDGQLRPCRAPAG